MSDRDILKSPEPMGGPGARKISGTGRPNRNRPTLSLDPTAPSTPEAIQAVKDHNTRQRQRQAWGGHDGLCLVTYVEAHTLRYGKDQEHLTEVPPTETETLANCWCTCKHCWNSVTARCVCRVCPCVRPERLLVSSSGYPRSSRPSYGFQ